MGDWITSAPGLRIEAYTTRVELPDVSIVRAMAWWGSEPVVPCCVVVNGQHEFFDRMSRHKRRYLDIAFQLRPGQNTIEIRFVQPQTSVPITFGLRIQFADGQEIMLPSSEQWKARASDGTEHAVQSLSKYGDATGPGEVNAFPIKRLAPAWFCRDFEVGAGLKRANLLHTGVGYAHCWMNGNEISDRVLSPPQTDYEDFCMYESDDVTPLMKTGTNTLAVQLSPGWFHQVGGFGTVLSYGRPRLKAALRLEYEDGTVNWVVSDARWRWKEAGLREANVYVGETLDYRLAHEGWKQPENREEWVEVLITDPPGKRLMLRDLPAMRRVREIAPVTIKPTGPHSWLLDFGENIAGWVRFPVHESPGTEVLVRYSEHARDGRIENVPSSFWWCHGEPQRDLIIADGKSHTYESRYTYKGFRYVEISGLSSPPDTKHVRAVVVNTDCASKANFDCSLPLLNRLWQMGVRTHLANMHSILEDCPHREKCQWGGDLHSSWSLGFHALESHTFYRQQVRLFYTGTMAQGNIPGLVGVGKRLTNVQMDFNWGISPLFLSWRLWTHGGDLETAREFLSHMRHYLVWFAKRSEDGFPHLYRHADHAAPVGDVPRSPQDRQLIAALNLFAGVERYAQLCDELQELEQAAWGRELAERTREAILTRYDRLGHTFRNGTHDSLALAFGIFRDEPDEQRALADALVLHYRKNGHRFDGGFMSYWIYPMLSRHGYVNDAVDMLTNTNYPGPAWSVQRWDATTFWEYYRSDEAGQFERSLSHHATNHPAAWLLTDLAGIRIDMQQPGGRHFLLAPCFATRLDSVSGSMKTITGGEVISRWQRDKNSVRWECEVPAGCQARIEVPGWESATDQQLPTSLEPGSYEFVLREKESDD